MAGMRVVVVKATDGRLGRPRRPAREVRGARRHSSPRSWSPTRRRTAPTRTPSSTCARSCTSTAVRCTSTAPTSTRCSGSPSRASSAATCRTSTCTRRSASRTAVAGRVSGRSRWRRTSRRTCRATRCIPTRRRHEGIGPVSAAPYGSAGILPISWAYIAMMGAAGLTEATDGRRACRPTTSPRRLQEHYPVLYKGHGGLVAHECILDLRALTKASGVSVDDVAKRLVDYGFHAPTMSFPVPGTFMVEPTESESLAELDRFVDAMIAIREEIADVESGRVELAASPLVHAPHTTAAITGEWDRALLPRRRRVPGRVTSSTSTGRRWPGSTRRTATATWCAACPDPSAFAETRDRRRRPPTPARRWLEQISARRAGCPVLVAGTSRNGAVDWSCALGDTGRAVPGRVDHQDVHCRRGHAAAGRRSARARRPDRSAPAGCAVRRRDHPSTARARQRDDRRAGRTVVGAACPAVTGTTWSRPTPSSYVFAPGRRHHYSNLGYALLGRLVEELSGGSWWDVVTDTIARPARPDRDDVHAPRRTRRSGRHATR